MVFTMFLDIMIESLKSLSEEASSLGFTISWAMTKLQSLSDFLPPPAPPPPQMININTEEVEVVDTFSTSALRLPANTHQTLRQTVASSGLVESSANF